jgi:hypothetical protein
VIVTTFDDQHQVLKTQITELEVALAAAIEAKRVADLAAPWLAQLALTNTALTTASNAVIEANSGLASTVDFTAKTAAIEASKQALCQPWRRKICRSFSLNSRCKCHF